jgi:hypothetical protein
MIGVKMLIWGMMIPITSVIPIITSSSQTSAISARSMVSPSFTATTCAMFE